MTDFKNDSTINQITRIIPRRIRQAVFLAISNDFSSIHEIVLRTERPLCVYKNGIQYFVTSNGCLTTNSDSQSLVIVNPFDITECFNIACGYSVYSHINEIKEGFVTINGGHRVGFCGTAVVTADEITNIRDISTISIRISREIIGCGRELSDKLNASSKGMLICGAPCSGKTTVLRDIARSLSEDYSRRVSVIDTKSEIAGVYKGVLGRNLGMCDIFDSYPRIEGILQAIRLLSPEYLLCDEIGSNKDADAIFSAVNSGVVCVATMHARNPEELKRRIYLSQILSTGAFENVYFLSGRCNPGQVVSVVDCREVINC